MVLIQKWHIEKKNDRYFQSTFALTGHHKEIQNHSERVKNIKPFIDHYNWDGIIYPTLTNDLKKLGRNTLNIALVML